MTLPQPFSCDVTLINDFRALPYEILQRKEELLRDFQKPGREGDLYQFLSVNCRTFEMARHAIARLQWFFESARNHPAYYLYPTVLYRHIAAQYPCDADPRGLFHFAAPSVMRLSMEDSTFKNKLKVQRLDLTPEREVGVVQRIKGILPPHNHKTFSERWLATAPPISQWKTWQDSILVATHTKDVAPPPRSIPTEHRTDLLQSILQSSYYGPFLEQVGVPEDWRSVLPRSLPYFYASVAMDAHYNFSKSRQRYLAFVPPEHHVDGETAQLTGEAHRRLMLTVLETIWEYVDKPNNSEFVKLADYCWLPARNQNDEDVVVDVGKVKEIVDNWETEMWRAVLPRLYASYDTTPIRARLLRSGRAHADKVIAVLAYLGDKFSNWLMGK